MERCKFTDFDCPFMFTLQNQLKILKDKLHRRNALCNGRLREIKDLKEKVLESGHIIRQLDENSEYIEYWTNDGEYRTIDGIKQKEINKLRSQEAIIEVNSGIVSGKKIPPGITVKVIDHDTDTDKPNVFYLNS
ncbi:hypothetical protein LCGC14_1929430 [marine sediment metagenome]|uniref:Uncharacterized protein n=1 Tax=marine sediment metagenome TaxID=412755 RepID=A0A0F9I2B4_9ZZZZ